MGKEEQVTTRKRKPAAKKPVEINEEVTQQQPLRATYHIVHDGENIQTIAAKYLPEGWTRNEYAQHLANQNKNWNVGAVIHLG